MPGSGNGWKQAFPIHNGNQLEGAMAIVVDASYIRSEGIALWQRSFWRIVAFVIVIVAITSAYGALVPSSPDEPRGGAPAPAAHRPC